MKAMISGLFCAAALALTPMAALADRTPDATERAAIEKALRAAGFTTWKEIELDDGRWEVDDARAEDGRKYDVELDRNYNIIRREPD